MGEALGTSRDGIKLKEESALFTFVIADGSGAGLQHGISLSVFKFVTVRILRRPRAPSVWLATRDPRYPPRLVPVRWGVQIIDRTSYWFRGVCDPIPQLARVVC